MAFVDQKLDPNSKTNWYGQTALHEAAEANDLEKINYLLSLGADVNFKDRFGKTPLHLAAKSSLRNNHFYTIERLLKSGADVNAQDAGNRTPLHYLVYKASARSVQLLLNAKADFNLKDSDNETPLFKAVQSKNFKVVKLLLDHGSDANVVNENGLTLLHAAVKQKELGMIKCLLACGADIEVLNSSGQTPLMSLLTSKKISYELLIFFLEYADVNTFSPRGENVLRVNQRIDFWRRIVIHLAKLKALDIFIDSSILETISNDFMYKPYFEKCLKELEEAKNSKIQNSWVSFFDLLVGSKRKLKNYAGNQDLIQDFQKIDWLKKFPIYEDAIYKNVKKAMERRNAFDESSILLSNNLPIFNPNHLIIRDILDCLTAEDYQNMTLKVINVIDIC